MESIKCDPLSLQSILISIDETRNLLLAGREIEADRKLQGVQVKLRNLFEGQGKPNDVAKESDRSSVQYE